MLNKIVLSKMGIKQKYQELSKKYNLPSFDEIDKELEISSIEKEEFLLRELRRKIVEKIEDYAKFLDGILDPETTMANMYETKIFEGEERNELFKAYQKLMYFDRFSMEISIGEDEQRSADYINAFFKEWNELKEKISKFVKKAKEGWLKHTDIKEEHKYMG